MPYFQEKELLLYVERELLPNLAEDLVVDFYEYFGVNLDLTPASLERVESTLLKHPDYVEADTLAGPVGAYLGAVLCRSDGARWAAGFDMARGAEGYQASRVRLYDQDVDVFDLAHKAIAGSCSLPQAFSSMHRAIPPGRSISVSPPADAAGSPSQPMAPPA